MVKMVLLLLMWFVLLINILIALCGSPASIVYIDTDGSGDFNCDGTDDHIQINQALDLVRTNDNYTTVYLKGPNTYLIDATLIMGNHTIFEGDSDAVVTIPNEADWGPHVPLIVNHPDGGSDFTIQGFKIDGNSENQSVPLGSWYYTMVLFTDETHNVTIQNMYLYHGSHDGLRIESGTNVIYQNNTVYKIGHDALFCRYSNYITVCNNDIYTRCNAGLRMANTNHVDMFNNTIHSWHNTKGDSTGPGIEIEKSTGYIMDDIEIYNNTIHTLEGSGIWLSAYDKDDVIRSKNVHIHHNTFYDVGHYWDDTGYSNAAITIGQFNNTIIENNIIDNGGRAGIKSYIYPGRYVMDVQFTINVRNNIIMNCDVGVATGLWNYAGDNHIFVSEYNCLYNNVGGACSSKKIIITNDIHVDPLFTDSSNHDYHLKSASGRWSENGWITDDATSPLIDAGHTTSDYSNEPSPNGNRINIGRYGNTAEASMSVSDQPTASAGPDQTVTTDDTVTLDGSAFTDDIGIESYVWDFDDSNGLQQDATGAAVQHTYNTAGTYTATLTVSDVDGNADSDTVAIIVNEGYITPTPNGTSSSIYDNRLHETSPDAVIPDNDYVDIGHSTDVGRYRDVIWFNLSMYNTTDTISNATLSLYWYYPVNSTRNNDTVVEIYRPVDWDPDYVSWNHRTSDTPWNTPGGDWFDKNEVAQGSVSYASVTFSGSDVPDNRYNEFDVTELVQDYISGEYENTGFFLKAQDEYDNYIAFYSSDWSNVDQRPKLTVITTQDHTPVMASIGPKTVDEESTLSFTVSASDVDGDVLIYSASGLPSGATFDSASGSFTWTPANGQAGTYQVTFEVTDGQLIDSETITLTVNEGSITLIPNGTASSVYDNRLREASPDAVLSNKDYVDIGDRNGVASFRDVIWFNLSMYNTTDTISNATLSLYWYYPVNSTRNNDTVVEIYRPVDWDPDYVSWNHRTSDTPWNTPGGDWFDKNEVAQGSVSYASVTFSGSDVPDNRYNEFDVTELVQDYISGEYENTGFFLKAQDEYDNYIAFYSSDWSNVDQRPKLTVITTQDHTPVMASIGPKTVDEESTLSFTVSASDVDGDVLIYSASGLPSGATFDSASGSFTWTPANGQAGTYQVTFEVTDGQLIDSETITLTVNEGSITLIPNGTASSVYDNRLREASPDAVLSNKDYVDIGDRNGVASFRDVIWFNLSMYNTTDTISNATLSLYWYYPVNSTRNNDTVVEIYRPVDWDPDYVSWNHRTSDTPWNTPGGDWFDKNEVAQGSVSYASVTFSGSDVPDNRYNEFDVTELVQDYISGEYENTGFFLKAQDEYDNYIAFYSSDWSNVDQRPKLTVTT